MLFTFAEQPTVSQPEKREYMCHHTQHLCVHLLGWWNTWSIRWCCIHVCIHVRRSTPFPPHSICVVGESFSLLMIFWSASLCCGYFHDCTHVDRFVPTVSFIVWHIAALPLLTRLRLFIDHSSYLSNITTPRSSCPVYVVVAPSCFTETTVTVDESWRKWRQLEYQKGIEGDS